MSRSSQFTLDLVSLGILRWVIKSAWVPIILQVLTLVIAAGLLLNGWGIGGSHSPDELMTLRKTNLTTLSVWGLWWPAMILIALLFGRAWCTVCPMELINRMGYRFGTLLGLPRRALGRWLSAGWFILLAYVVLQLLVAGVKLHRVPHLTSIMLLVLAALALGVGIVFDKPRSFCKGFCPAKPLLSIYGRFTPLQLDVRDPEMCEGCATRECVDSARRDRFDARSCPSLAVPFDRTASDDCVLCFQCAKACPYANVGFGLVRPTASSRRPALLKPYEAVFVLLAAGFVAHEVIGEVKPMDAYFHAVPERLNALLPSVSFGWFEAGWFLVLLPLVLWTATSVGAYAWGYRGSVTRLLVAAATGAAPVVAIAHLAKAVAKIGSWGGYLPGSLADPRGIETFNVYASGHATAPARLVGLPLLGWLMIVLLLALTWRSWRGLRDSAAELLPAAKAGAAATALFFIVTLLAWPLWR